MARRTGWSLLAAAAATLMVAGTCNDPQSPRPRALLGLPDAFALKSYAGIIGTGLIFGALAGWATKAWAP